MRSIKEILYFPVAYYFRFFAQIRLLLWRPRIIVVTGSSGKTTLLNLVESQLGQLAHYSHEANSSYGIPFNILGLHRKTLLPYEWLGLFIKAPFGIFKSLPKEKNYVVEVDCDRPGEGKFLGTLLKPEVTLWLNSSKTHSMNFDEVVRKKQFISIEKAVAHEFGYLIEHTSKLVIVNGDSDLINAELHRAKAEVKKINKKNHLQEYQISSLGQTRFRIDGREYSFNYLLPEDNFYGIKMTLELADYLEIKPDYSFFKFSLPPGRSSVFKGFKNITIVDSSYNANLDSMRVVLDMFNKVPSSAKAPADAKALAGKSADKWAVLGDMIEQGKSEKEEHEKLAELISKYRFDRIVLMGPRVSEYTYPRLRQQGYGGQGAIIERFLKPTEVLEYLMNNLQGGEIVLFKGARFLEGVVEHLLINKEEVKKLCRQEKVWRVRRAQWGL